MKYVKKEPKPVDKIELNERHIKLRFILFILCFCVVLVCAVFIFIGFSREESGWTRIEASPKTALSCEEDFVLSYDLGTTKEGATAEARNISAIYTEALETAYMLLDRYHAYDDVVNVYTINHAPGEILSVDGVLYAALEQMVSSNAKLLYMAPIYSYYEDIFGASSVEMANALDPYYHSSVQTYFQSILSFIDSNQIELELLGENKIRLSLSPEYLSFAEENEITGFLDFSWLKNAFIIDYVAEALIAKGYINGYISSYDGYFKNLDTEEKYNYTADILDTVEGSPSRIGQFVSKGTISIVQFRGFMYYQSDTQRYYKMNDGTFRHLYIDSTDGLSKSAVSSLTCYSLELSCSQIALQTATAFIADEFVVPSDKNIGFIWSEGQMIKYTDSSLRLENLYHFGDIAYQGEWVE